MTRVSPEGVEKSIFDTLRAASEIKTFQDLTQLFKAPLEALGFPHFAAVEASTLSKGLSLRVLFGQPDVAWHDFYTREALGSVDPRLRHMLGSAEPAFLSELAPRSSSDAADLQFLSLFRAYGHADCYVWPIHLPEGRVRGVLMLSDLHKVHLDARVAVGALAGGFHAAGAKILRSIKAASGGGIELRPRQMECLYWARRGKSSADIGHILGISPRTVDEHISHACEALGVRTRIQAVARAVMLGLF